MDEQNEKRDIMDTEDVVDATEVTDADEPRMAETRQAEKNPVPVTGHTPVMEEERLAPLFEDTDADKFRSHWLEIQSTFVDDPRESVRKADALVDEVIQSITRSFAQKRTTMEDQWNSGENTSTEDLRVAIKRYRSFFERLLTLES
jgi:hypothetical protein